MQFFATTLEGVYRITEKEKPQKEVQLSETTLPGVFVAEKTRWIEVQGIDPLRLADRRLKIGDFLGVTPDNGLMSYHNQVNIAGDMGRPMPESVRTDHHRDQTAPLVALFPDEQGAINCFWQHKREPWHRSCLKATKAVLDQIGLNHSFVTISRFRFATPQVMLDQEYARFETLVDLL